MSNLDTWRKGETTDPTFTKDNKHAAGGSTSINTTYTFKRATEVFGPVGIGWGYEVTKDEIIDGCLVAFGDKENEQMIQTKIHTLQIRFWYVLDGVKGEFYQYGHTDFVVKNKWGAYTESEPHKKSLSDAIKKALSMLGFSADIYLGMFDDQNYVDSVKMEIEADKAESGIDIEEQKVIEFRNWVDERIQIYDSIGSLKTIKTAHTKSIRLLHEKASFGRISQKQHDGGVIALTEHFEKVSKNVD